jgi:hypothetical protein
MVSCLYSTVQLIAILAKAAPSVKVPPKLKNNENSKAKIRRTRKRIRRCRSHWSSQKHFKLNIYVYSV